jgi:hypothetical protein
MFNIDCADCLDCADLFGVVLDGVKNGGIWEIQFNLVMCHFLNFFVGGLLVSHFGSWS